MTNFSPLSSTVSFDDLLKANKQQFDRVFSAQTKELGLLGSSHRPTTSADLASASLASEAAVQSSDLYAMLNHRFGSRWSSEIVEHKTERGSVTVLCKLTVDGTSKMQFGSARANGDEGAALRRATEVALRGCAEMFGDAAVLESRAEQPTVGTRPSALRSNGGAGGSTAPAVPPREGRRLDTVSLDLIENALRNARHEMDAVLFRSAMSPVIREQHDEFPMITDPKGRMIVGQFGSYVNEMLAEQKFDLEPGDVILQSDPYKCGGAISHVNDWMVLVPVFHQGELVGFTSMFGHMMDVGGWVPGSMPTDATSIFGEGLRIPPLLLYHRGEINKPVLDLIMNNTRTPEMNYSDLMAIIAGCRAGEKRVIEICDRFGRETYKQACDALLDRTNRAMRKLIVQNLPEEPKSFEDYLDDDGRGNGPFKMKLTVWREGDNAYFDWTGTSPQAPGPINFYLHEGMFKMFIGVYMIMVFDPQILFNDGFYDLIHVTLPKGSLVQPDFPAALGSPHSRAVKAVRRARRGAELQCAGNGDRGRLRLQPAFPLFGRGQGGQAVPAHGNSLRRNSRSSGRRRDGWPFVVAAVPEHPERVPGNVLSIAHRGLYEHHRYRRRRQASRRQRSREDLFHARRRRHLDPRRPSRQPALGHPRRTPRRRVRRNGWCARTAAASRCRPRSITCGFVPATA